MVSKVDAEEAQRQLSRLGMDPVCQLARLEGNQPHVSDQVGNDSERGRQFRRTLSKDDSDSGKRAAQPRPGTTLRATSASPHSQQAQQKEEE